MVESIGRPLSPQLISDTSKLTGISEPHLYHVLRGDLMLHKKEEASSVNVALCKGLACCLRGGDQLSKAVQNWMGIEPGEMTVDRYFYLKESACLFRCAEAPALKINDDVFGEVLPSKGVYFLQKVSDKKISDKSTQTFNGKNPYQVELDKND
ncbi:MAG: NAD(P)H-dependent oxidoreductase subunit E [Holosporaceae bacterium]|nr:MAG: NAD(P)H-dependent oxidoreductase subunit E [Holosporaceae bacterium]